MCYADTAANDDGTVTAFCYCGWSTVRATPEAADDAAVCHRADIDDVESLPAD
ncbi:hypothetical protein AB0I60_05175 [Actinosynnema sp. NPDC050436]|uniref:hypothetical protein n=1 Tax=Actinosynnema sp. NPDC050436 TaxID=3155659 RepID=UPI00340F8071